MYIVIEGRRIFQNVKTIEHKLFSSLMYIVIEGRRIFQNVKTIEHTLFSTLYKTATIKKDGNLKYSIVV